MYNTTSKNRICDNHLSHTLHPVLLSPSKSRLVRIQLAAISRERTHSNLNLDTSFESIHLNLQFIGALNWYTRARNSMMFSSHIRKVPPSHSWQRTLTMHWERQVLVRYSKTLSLPTFCDAKVRGDTMHLWHEIFGVHFVRQLCLSCVAALNVVKCNVAVLNVHHPFRSVHSLVCAPNNAESRIYTAYYRIKWLRFRCCPNSDVQWLHSVRSYPKATFLMVLQAPVDSDRVQHIVLSNGYIWNCAPKTNAKWWCSVYSII